MQHYTIQEAAERLNPAEPRIESLRNKFLLIIWLSFQLIWQLDG
jgi:hypothetical protein